MKYWFTADMHFGHANIIKYYNRPYKNVEEMNNKLIKNWNQLVKPDDYVIHVGDFSSSYNKVDVESIINKLNGHIIFIKGNHDSGRLFKIEELTFIIGTKEVNVIHYPELAIRKYNIVGHVHDIYKSRVIRKGKQKRYFVNVGVDVWNYRPISVETINKEFEKLIKDN